MIKHLFLLLVLQFHSIRTNEGGIPIVITTWRFENAARKAWDEIQQSSALKAIVNGAGVCEIEQCDRTVGYGGSPDEAGETTLDALIMDGKNMKVGAVGSLRRIKNAIGVAKCVMDHTEHSFLVGELATEFAVQMGFKEEVLTTTESKQMWMAWHNKNKCQPNFWTNVIPNPKETCGPYEPVTPLTPQIYVGPVINEDNHDTIGMVAIDSNGDVAAGTSTNGAKFKIPGRIGDSPIPGAGAYADNEVGGAAATGDGDVMLRFLPSFLAVEEMRRGASPADATKTAISRIIRYYPRFMGAVIAVNKTGSYAASCHGLPTFPYIVHHKDKFSSEPLIVECM